MKRKREKLTVLKKVSLFSFVNTGVNIGFAHAYNGLKITCRIVLCIYRFGYSTLEGGAPLGYDNMI